jgi:hypothetical protein
MKEVVEELPEAVGPMKFDTVTLAVEISAKGTVSLARYGRHRKAASACRASRMITSL